MEKHAQSNDADYAIDEIDRRILKTLQQRSDIPNSELADLIGLTPAPCLRRVSRLKEDGIIKRFSIQIDTARLGFRFAALVEITLDQHSKGVNQAFLETIKPMPEVLVCHMVTGDCDFIMHVVVRDLNEFRQLLWDRIYTIKGIKRVRSSVIFDTYKDEVKLAF